MKQSMQIGKYSFYQLHYYCKNFAVYVMMQEENTRYKKTGKKSALYFPGFCENMTVACELKVLSIYIHLFT